MKKRFSLAVALLPDPRNLLFDELLNGLDPEGIHLVRSLMVSLKKDGKAVLLSSHILSEIESIADRIVFIHRGKIIKEITREELTQTSSSRGTLKIVIQNLSNDALQYLQTFGGVKVEGKDTVILTGIGVDPIQLNTDLIKRGFLIREFSFEKSSLEDYFFKLIEPNSDPTTPMILARS